MKFIKEDFELKIAWLLINLDIEYRNINHYIQSFIHRSVLNENIWDFKESNERLEFLWDAVLELVITELLFVKFPDYSEWRLTDIRSAIVRWQNLAKISHKIWLHNYILLSKWETQAGWNENPYILANTLEAFLWAIHQDLGYKESAKFVVKHIFSTLDEILDKKLYVDAKSHFQEISQEKFNITPTYEVLNEIGEDHNKIYTVWAYIGTKEVWIWDWSSKKKAQQKAAENAIERMNEWVWE